MIDTLGLLVDNFVGLFTESAPYLLLGMFIAGIIHQLVPKHWVEKTLGRKNSVVTASLIGAPLPLCSCSVIPVAMGIRRSGASKASTASFLVATPETGVDSIGITYALMGPVMAIARPIAAIVSAIVCGLIIRQFGQSTVQSEPEESTPSPSCCCGVKPAPSPSALEQFYAVLQFGYGKLLRDFMSWLLIGLFFAALIKTLLPPGVIAQYGQGIGAMLLIVLISVPMYICATASTPLAVGLMISGVSPGAALVFMLTGPATNIATLMVIKKELGMRELVLYLTSVISTAVLSGLVLDYVLPAFDLQLSLQHGHHHGMVGTLFQLSAVILAILILAQFGRQIVEKSGPSVNHSH